MPRRVAGFCQRRDAALQLEPLLLKAVQGEQLIAIGAGTVGPRKVSGGDRARDAKLTPALGRPIVASKIVGHPVGVRAGPR